MIGYCETAVSFGAEVVPIRVEASTRPGKPKFHLIGLGDNAVRESRERISAALASAQFEVPDQILINLAPADVKKTGSGLELAMAWAVLTASKQVQALPSTWVFGELSLDGELKPVRGLAGLVSRAAVDGINRVIVPIENEEEALLVDGVEVLGVASLSELASILQGDIPSSQKRESDDLQIDYSHLGFEDVVGQDRAKRAFEIAACGGHNLLLIGPPGCGKSMLAERLPSLLPPLRREERLAIAQIASAVGESIAEYLSGRRPFRSPHHVISEVGLIGGGADLRPGEVSLAHCGVLFLDEFPEFARRTIESLRAPLETRQVTITRAIGSTTYPAAFQLVAAMNPCPCGRFAMKANRCRCTRYEIAKYLKKLSQPILERIDLHVEAEPVSLWDSQRPILSNDEACRREEERRERVRLGVEIQIERQQYQNARLPFEQLDPALTRDSRVLVNQFSRNQLLSARGLVRLLRVSRTIADLDASALIEEEHVLEARTFQALERMWNYIEGRAM
ncbi:MAG: YifB family Mg chelatase-like AAA ATPase [Bdellovibrionales bacterium]|nr:YifB family Mg chelatase-like AAA ATPase [Bdellovibrionales bacterium]